jgi:hypothetical protein
MEGARRTWEIEETKDMPEQLVKYDEMRRAIR